MARCAESLFGQTLKEGVEFIFIDDASPDGSLDVLRTAMARHPERKGQTRIITHPGNKGLPASRNTGLDAATGEYVFHCDSDDFVEPDMLESLYATAARHDADAVWCDYYLSYPRNERYMAQPKYATADEALGGMLCGKMKYNVWNKLVRRKLYTENHIRFPSGHAMGEDMTMIRLFAFARKTVYLPRAFYHYVQFNASSMTRELTPAHLAALRLNTEGIISFIKSRYGGRRDLEVYSFCLLMKWPFLVSDKRRMYKLWKEWFPEANACIWQDKQVSRRIRFVEWCASKGWFAVVWLHYWVVVRFAYSLIYK